MVKFISLFLSLTVGPQPVELAVEPGVARVDLILDRQLVGVVEGAPWRLWCDFGNELEPHELVAVARDRQGKELGRITQRVNLPRPRAEAEILLQRGEAGLYRSARIVWQEVEESDPEAVVVSFDGQPVPLLRGDRVELPEYDPESIHLLSAEVRFPGPLLARAEVAFGGLYGDSVHTQLTAIPVEVVRSSLPPAAALKGWFLARGKPLPVVAVEQGSRQIYVVRDKEFRRTFRRHNRKGRIPRAMRKGDSIQLVVPSSRTVPRQLGGEKWLFPISPNLGRGGLSEVLTAPIALEEVFPQHLAEAVAVAGLEAASGEQVRGVVLIKVPSSTDHGKLDPSNVQRYLERLRVPLFVWSFGPGIEAQGSRPWPGSEDVSEPSSLRAAIRSLRQALDRQYVVWVEGDWMPQEVELAVDAQATIRFAGSQARTHAGL